MDHRENAAFHEACHVVVRSSNGLPTPAFHINCDGTGWTSPSGSLVQSLDVLTDVAMAGVIAEEILTGRYSRPSADDIASVLFDPYSDDFYGLDDLEGAIEIIRVQRPGWTESEIAAHIQASCERVHSVLKAKWSQVEQLANAALDSPDGSVLNDTIERICPWSHPSKSGG